MLTEVAQRTANTATGDAQSLATKVAREKAITLLRGATGGAADEAEAVIGSGAGRAVATEAGTFAAEAERKILSPATVAKGAGAVAGLIGAGTAMWNDSDKVKNHKMTAAHATADVAVKGATAMAAGVAGAEMGAVIGSFIPVPVVGTAIGAAAGFVGGVAGSVIVNEVAERSGAIKGATNALDHALQGQEAHLQKGFEAVARGKDAVTNLASRAKDAAVETARGALHNVENTLDDLNPFSDHKHEG